jgi:hypothetical protein
MLFHFFNLREHLPQMSCMPKFGNCLDFSGSVCIKPFLENSAEKGFSQQCTNVFRKRLMLEDFEKSHCHNFAHNPKFIGFELGSYTPNRLSFPVFLPLFLNCLLSSESYRLSSGILQAVFFPSN